MASQDFHARARRAADTRRFRRFMRRVLVPVDGMPATEADRSYHWSVGMLTKELWDAMRPGARRELTELVNKAVIAVAERYHSGR